MLLFTAKLSFKWFLLNLAPMSIFDSIHGNFNFDYCVNLSFFNFSARTISPELATQAAMLNRQTSRSTEDMFTPVIKKHSKWKNKKAGISNLSKDDSAHTYSSSSSASSTTSSTVAPSSGQNNASYQAASNSHSSILSAKPAK